jgi:hypothetical protein
MKYFTVFNRQQLGEAGDGHIVETRRQPARVRIIRFSGICGALMLLLIPYARADYYTGYTDWQSLTSAGKSAYVAGVLDFLVQKVSHGEAFSVFSAAVEKCRFGGWNITELDIVNAVDHLYDQHIGLRKESPAMVTYLVIVQKCEDPINKYMEKTGQKPPSFGTMLHQLSKPAGIGG